MAEQTTKQRNQSRAVGAAIIVVVAIIATLAMLQAVEALNKPAPVAQPTSTETKTEKPPEETPVVTAPTTPVASKTAVTTASVRLRSNHAATSSTVTNIPSGTTVTLGDYVDDQWQQVTVGTQSGYVAKQYLKY